MDYVNILIGQLQMPLLNINKQSVGKPVFRYSLIKMRKKNSEQQDGNIIFGGLLKTKKYVRNF